jgi:tetratricopeptide (TPR) repeat protein
MRAAAVFAQAEAEHKAGRLRAAQRLYRRCLAEDAENPQVLAGLGAVLARSGDMAGAEDFFRRAVAADPAAAEALAGLGEALCARGRRDEGMSWLRRALDLRSDLVAARRALALALVAEGAVSLEPRPLLEAEEILTGLMAAGADDAETGKAWKRVRWHLSRLRRDAAKARQAFATFVAVADKAELPLVRVEMARIELESGDSARAAALCAQAVPVPPGWRMDSAVRLVGGWSVDRPLAVTIERDGLLLPGGRDWLVLRADGTMRFDGIVNANPEAGQYVRLVVPAGRVLLARPSAEAVLDDPHLLLGGLPNYYHWMIDTLPRLRLVSDATLPILVNPDLAPFQQQTLALLGIDPARLRPLAGPAAVRCRQLVIPDAGADFQVPHPGTIAWLRSTFGQAGGASARLWVSRRDAGQRRVLNEEQVITALAARGFTVVVPGELDLAGQIAAFAGAEMVAGPHGAALTNLVFSPPGARVLEIMPGRHNQLGFFPPLSAACGHIHRRMVAESVGADSQNADMIVDVARLMEELDALG